MIIYATVFVKRHYCKIASFYVFALQRITANHYYCVSYHFCTATNSCKMLFHKYSYTFRKNSMQFQEIMEALAGYGTEQNRKIYRRHGAKGDMFGVSFAHQGQLVKAIKKAKLSADELRKLAEELWQTKNVDARTLSAMIDPPALHSPESLTRRLYDCDYFYLADSIAKIARSTPYAEQVLKEWIAKSDELFLRAAYTLLGVMALESPDLSDEFFAPHIKTIIEKIHTAPNRAKEGMNNCLIAIGGRNEALRDLVFEAADIIGPVEIDHGETSCQTFLIKPYIEKMYARMALKPNGKKRTPLGC